MRVTEVSAAADSTLAVTVTGFPGFGTAGLWMTPVTVGAGAANRVELAAPGVPKLSGTGRRKVVPYP